MGGQKLVIVQHPIGVIADAAKPGEMILQN